MLNLIVQQGCVDCGLYAEKCFAGETQDQVDDVTQDSGDDDSYVTPDRVGDDICGKGDNDITQSSVIDGL